MGPISELSSWSSCSIFFLISFGGRIVSIFHSPPVFHSAKSCPSSKWGKSSGYSVTELEAPEGYQIDNPGPQYVVLPNENGKTVTVTFTDTPEITSEGSIRKVDADDPTKGLAGAVIRIDGVDNSFTGTYTTGTGG